MLGMMNCPTESVEFYSASPALKRVIAGRRRAGSDDTSTTASSSLSADDEHQIANTASKCDDAAKQSTANEAMIDVDEEVEDEEDVVRVFTEARHRPQVTYTTDGRKLLNGKLYSIDMDASTAVDPLKMWDRLIMSSMTAKLTQQQKPSRRWSITTATGDGPSTVANVESKSSDAGANERALIDKTSTKKYRRSTRPRGAAPEEPLLVDDLSNNNVTKVSCASL